MNQRFTVQEFEQAIADAIADHNFEAAVGLLTMFATQHPKEAGELYEMLKAALAGDATRATLLAALSAHDRRTTAPPPSPLETQ